MTGSALVSRWGCAKIWPGSMQKLIDHLNLLAAISGLLAFVWVGLRSDWDRIKSSWQNWRNDRRFGTLVPVAGSAGPYLLFGAAVIYLWPGPPDIVITHHVFQAVKTDFGETAINDLSRPPVEVTTSAPHVQITLRGAIVGPELKAIKNRYGRNPITVYALVQQPDLKPPQCDLIWMQVAEAGQLDALGKYEVKAYLGGIGSDSAKDDDRFNVFIFIPKDQESSFADDATFDGMASLPPRLFLSDPMKLKVVRQNQAGKH